MTTVKHTINQMKLLSYLLLLSCLSFTSKGSLAQSKLKTLRTTVTNPGELKFRIYIPQTKNSKDSLPLLVVLHGCSQNAKKIARISDWNRLAEQHQFIVLYPEQTRINNPSLCFNWFLRKDNSRNGECESIHNMVEAVKKIRHIDSSKVFVYGVSAGAAMSTALLANYPNTFAGGAIIAGSPYGTANTAFEGMKAMNKVKRLSPENWVKYLPYPESKRKPKLIICHGYKDRTVSFQNSEELLKQWTAYHKIDTLADIKTDAFNGNELVNKEVHTDDDSDPIITFYKIKELTHRLPIDPGTGPKQGGKKAFFATDIDFFLSYHLAKDFGLIREAEK